MCGVAGTSERARDGKPPGPPELIAEGKLCARARL